MDRLSKPRIHYLDGLRFRRAFIAGARQLIGNRDRLNAINVFPVADSDTGTNMAGTLGNVIEGIQPSRERSIGRMLGSIADLALSAARGCSGTILAQFFYGMAQEFAGTSRLSTADFGYGVRKAVLYPWEAVSDPREGTILTVLRDWGDAIHRWSDRTQDYVDLLFRARHAACRSLQATTAQLSPLQRAGVVDAGAQGLVHMLTGVTRFMANGTIREADRELMETPTEDVAAEVVEDPRFRYCTQFVIEGSDLDTRALRGELSGLGDSLIVAGSHTRAKVHIHSNTPARAFHTVDQHGTIVVQRIEDMSAQFRAAHTTHKDIAIVVDSSCDMPQE
ncbi:MAG TPA: DAK2 domain-containing protein, partial [Spirochaetia bacterium]|nr:DAK2 domain-containing protein [Spirochaetia bacterium]